LISKCDGGSIFLSSQNSQSYMEAKKREGENGKEEEKIEMMPFFSHSLPT